MDESHVYFAGKPAGGAPRGSRRGSSSPPVVPALATPPDPLAVRILQLSGLNPAHYRPNALNRRIPACLRLLKVANAEQAMALLERRPELIARLTSTLLLGVTEFCRDRPVFEGLNRLLPNLLRRGAEIRIWSAACSTGQELYSIAIGLAQLQSLDRAVLLGTDCRSEAIEHARIGLYDKAALNCLEPAIRDRYFAEERQAQYRIRPEIQKRVRWRVADLFAEIPSGRWSVVLWRNMAIYLHMSSAEEIWRKLYEAMEAGGLLVTGKAERPPDALGLCRLDACIYQKSK